MGHGRYSEESRSVRADSLGYKTKSTRAIFKERSMNSMMNPNGVDIRESRDSDEHPNSLSIILGLDVTGSMGSIPHYLVKEGLPNIMVNIIEGGVKDPQLLFLGIGDHECDSAPLQIGQFESSDDLLDHWLTTVFLEGGGGANYGESYLLAWYFAAFHTSIDCFEKRNQKGLLFTIGDEPCLKKLPKTAIVDIMGGSGKDKSFTSEELFESASEMYDVYHLNLMQGNAGRSSQTQKSWGFMGDRFINIEDKRDVVNVIAEIVTKRKSVGFITEDDINLEL